MEPVLHRGCHEIVRALGREEDIRIDAQLAQHSVSSGAPVGVTYRIQNLSPEPVAVAPKRTLLGDPVPRSDQSQRSEGIGSVPIAHRPPGPNAASPRNSTADASQPSMAGGKY